MRGCTKVESTLELEKHEYRYGSRFEEIFVYKVVLLFEILRHMVTKEGVGHWNLAGRRPT